MSNYYSLLTLQSKATSAEVEASFRRVVARYRPTLTIEQLFNDPRFIERVNAYLTLRGTSRTRYDELLKKVDVETPLPPTPLEEFSALDRQLFMARIASWRREPLEAIHLLRTLLQREPEYAPGWVMLGEVYFTVDRIEEGIQAYQKAVHADQHNAGYAARLQHAQDALAGRVRLKVELSPEEELLHEERRKRWHIASGIMLVGTILVTYALISLLMDTKSKLFPNAFHVPWIIVAITALGVFAIFCGLGYGRLLQSFERVMLWSGMQVGDRGTIRHYPFGLILFVTTVPSLWLAVLVTIVVGLMEEEWPVSPSIMLGACMLLTLILAYVVYLAVGHPYWCGTFIIGGNALVLAAMLGWWLGSFNMPEYS